MVGSLSLLFAGGGTGGHLLPGVVLAKAFLSAQPNTHITFLIPGSHTDIAILSNTPFAWYCDPLRSFPRSWEQYPIWGCKLIRSCGITLQVFRKFRPDIVIGLGGYGAFSAGIIARYQRLPLVLLESNRIAGKVVRWLSRWSVAVYTNFDIIGIAVDKIRKLGIPIRTDLPFDKKLQSIYEGKVTILVMGGSQGALCINEAVCESLPFLSSVKNRLRFIHLCGNHGNDRQIADAYEKHDFEARVIPFSANMGELYGQADMAICRAGGSTLAEITAVGLPSLLIPYANAAHGHQELNAVALEHNQAAVVVREKELSGRLLAAIICDCLSHPQKLVDMAQKARTHGNPRAAFEIVRDILSLCSSLSLKRE